MKIEKALANIQLLGTQVKKIEFENDFIVFYEQDDTKKYLDVSYNIKECSYDEKAKEYIGILALYNEMQDENEEKKILCYNYRFFYCLFYGLGGRHYH